MKTLKKIDEEKQMKISGSTKVFGILGYPVTHTFSPSMMNAAFQELGIDATYVPFPVSPDNLETVLQSLSQIGVQGLNITVPHKQTLLPLMDKITEEAKLICAVNCIQFKNGKSIGHNTDGAGFIKSLKEQGQFDPRGKNVLILGAGGAARAIAVALAQSNAKNLFIYNRTYERAAIVSQHINQHFNYTKSSLFEEHQLRTKEDLEKIDLVINATSLGLKPEDPIPVSPIFFREGSFFYDLIYHTRTEWLNAAEQTNMKTLNGLGMLLNQGALAFEFWTGKKAPLDVMEKALRSQLNG